MAEEPNSKRSYFKSHFHNGLQPLSLKSIPEDEYPQINSVSFSSIVDLVSKTGSREDVTSPPSFIPKSLAKYTGILLTLLASFLFSIGVLIVKTLNGPEYNFNSYSSSFWRYMGVMVPSIPLVMYFEHRHTVKQKESIFATVWPLSCDESKRWWTVIGLLSRGTLGGASVILRYFALEYLTIGDTAVITYATPVLVTIMAHFFLGEKMGIIPVVVALITFTGVVIMTRPPFITGEEQFDTNILIGTGLACGSLICASLIVIITRKIRKVHFSLMTLVFGIIGVMQAFGLAQLVNEFSVPSGLHDISFIIILMVTSFVAQMAIILALKFEQAGPVSLIRSCDVIFGFLLQFIFLGVAPDLLSSVGGIIVLSCVTVTGLRKWISTLPEDDKQRQRFRFLLL